MANLQQEIAAYEKVRDDLETEFSGKWVVFRDKKMVDSYDSFELAAEDAVSRFGRGPYLIRQVGAPPLNLPLAVVNGIKNAAAG